MGYGQQGKHSSAPRVRTRALLLPLHRRVAPGFHGWFSLVVKGADLRADGIGSGARVELLTHVYRRAARADDARAPAGTRAGSARAAPTRAAPARVARGPYRMDSTRTRCAGRTCGSAHARRTARAYTGARVACPRATSARVEGTRAPLGARGASGARASGARGPRAARTRGTSALPRRTCANRRDQKPRQARL